MDAQEAQEAHAQDTSEVPVPPEVSVQVPDPMALAENLARRICHDFASLLGTLNGLTELAGEDPEAAMLARETARRMAARLQLVRGAWGGGGDDLDGAAIVALADGLPGAERLSVACSALEQPLQDMAARLCLCLLLAGAGAMPRGGTIHVGSDAGSEDGAFWIELDGWRAVWPESLTAPANEAAAADARRLPGVLCQMLAASGGWHIAVDATRVVARPV